MVVSIKEKPRQTRKVGIRKTNKIEPLLTRRKPQNDVKSRGALILYEKFARNLTTVQMASGV